MRGKDNRINYIIIALICLILLNVGSLLISLIEDKYSVNDKIKEVFNQNLYYEDRSLFISLLSRTSSIISLHKSYQNQDKEESLLIDLSNKLKSYINNTFIKSQFPAILHLNTYSIDNEDLNENNIEEYEMKSNIVEDFIIIDEIEEYENLIIVDESKDNISLENIPDPINVEKLEVDKSIPYVLIYHTHGTESYSSLETNEHHTTDLNYNVTTIGKIIADTMAEKGHKVEHVTKYHDIPSYNMSYSESLKTVTSKMQENSNLKILLDIHRDGFDQNDPNVIENLDSILEKSKIVINGEEVATFFFVVGPDSENMEAVLNFAKYIKAITDAIYPNLCTGIIIKPIGRYNQFLSDYSALIEIGNNLNTMEEAERTAKILGEILSIAIDKIIK